MLNHLTSGLVRSLRALAAAAVLAAPIAHADEVTGAGATFPAPIYMKWGEDYAKAGNDKLNYQGVGSGAGVTQIINRTVDFGASDSPVATEKLVKEGLLQFPAVIGAVVIVVNIPGVDGNQVNLTGPVLADIYLGRIRMWDAPEIKALNPTLNLPKAPIAPNYRADASGTTSIFTNYLAAVSPDFKEKIGAANSVPWKTGVGAPGNAGVAAGVKNIKGGIGYVEFAYATENHMQMPALQNKAGRFVRPTEPGFVAAALQADWANAKDMAATMLNMTGDASWPIVSATYILMPKSPKDPARSLRVLKFFDWAFSTGGPAATKLHYIMLPENVQAQVRQRWGLIQAGGKPVWPAAS
jgi:phosphate transport system substrate-binding protein